MDNVLDYMKRKQVEAIHAYETNDELKIPSCTDLAMEVTLRLVNKGRVPNILRFSDKQRIFPATFDSRGGWSFHEVVQFGPEMYDVFLGRPVERTEYEELAFGREVSSRIQIPDFSIQTEILRYIRKPNAM